MAATLTEWRPQAGPQHEFLRSSAHEALYGGAAGGGKSQGILAGALRFVDRPSYRALLLRRTEKELKRTLVDDAQDMYRGIGESRQGGLLWVFPSGARILMSGLEHEDDRFRFGSAAFQYIGFDELSTFTKKQYEFLFSRCRVRGDPTIPCFVRAGTNPIGPHIEWVRRRWRWWVYEPGDHEDEFAGPYARPGQVLSVMRDDRGEDVPVPRGTPGARTRTFIPALLSDNPALAATDYGDTLLQLDPVTRAALAEGKWSVRDEPGNFFRREWFHVEPEVEGLVVARCRFWDRAATEESKRKGSDPDWTVGLRMALTVDGRFWIEDVRRARKEPADVERFVRETAERDAAEPGPKCVQVLEQEGGASGKSEVSGYVRRMAGIEVRGIRPSQDKIMRARPVSAMAAPPARNVYLVAAPWNWALLDELESFPRSGRGVHDDQVDALSGAFAWLAPMQRAQEKEREKKERSKRPLHRAPGGF